jgi:rhodanese-related sulfurtransferase
MGQGGGASGSRYPDLRENVQTIPFEIAPSEVKRRLEAGESLTLVDVREPSEVQIASILGAQLLPMRTVPAALQVLETAADTSTLIVFCHHGVRSLNAVHWLREQGIEACQSMTGGIDRWSLEIDPSIPRY